MASKLTEAEQAHLILLGWRLCDTWHDPVQSTFKNDPHWLNPVRSSNGADDVVYEVYIKDYLVNGKLK
jgi:hypothetical protein